MSNFQRIAMSKGSTIILYLALQLVSNHLIGVANCSLAMLMGGSFLSNQGRSKECRILFMKWLRACICLTKKYCFYIGNSFCTDLGVNKTQPGRPAIAWQHINTHIYHMSLNIAHLLSSQTVSACESPPRVLMVFHKYLGCLKRKRWKNKDLTI